MARLIGNSTRFAVERTVAEMRAGRPVRIHSDGNEIIVLAAEAVDGDVLASIASSTGVECALILSEPRARHLKIVATGGQPICLPIAGLTEEELCSLVYASAPELPCPSSRHASSLELAALKLVRYTTFLPAAIVLRGDVGDTSSCISVSGSDIADYDGVRSREIKIVSRAQVPLEENVDTEFVVFNVSDGLRDQVAVRVGRPDTSRPVLTRIHSACLTGDLFASLKCDCGEQLRLAVGQIAKAGGGVLLYLDQEGRGIGLRNKIRAYALQSEGFDTIDSDAALGYGADERRYDLAGRMLECLDIDKIVLLTNNPNKIALLGASRIRVAAHQRLLGSINAHNCNYLTTKANRAGHLLTPGAGL